MLLTPLNNNGTLLKPDGRVDCGYFEPTRIKRIIIKFAVSFLQFHQQSAPVVTLVSQTMDKKIRRPTNMETPSHSLVTLVTPCRDPVFARVKITASGLVHNLYAKVS